MNTPVLLIVYNRLNTTRQVLDKIREAGPTAIYVAGDGPKPGNSGDQDKVKKVRQYILENIDWPAEVYTLFQEENLGVKHAVSKALEWFFSFEEKGIILEDDCLPSSSFFNYCEELLSFYENDDRVGMITGRNELGTYHSNNDDYFLSTRAFIWGWATWKNRIECLDINIAPKITFRDVFALFRNTSSFLEFVYRMKNIQQLKQNTVDTWDYQWSIGLLLNSKFTIVPKKNMIKNIGFGEASTHTFQSSTDTVELFGDFKKIKHPGKLSIEKKFTNKTIKKHTGGLLRSLVPGFAVKFVRYFK